MGGRTFREGRRWAERDSDVLRDEASDKGQAQYTRRLLAGSLAWPRNVIYANGTVLICSEVHEDESE